MSAAIILNGAKPLLPGAVLALSSVPYFVGVVGWWTISRVLPGRFYSLVDDSMYSCYQRLVLFFFENVSGVKLNLYGDDVYKKNAEKEMAGNSNSENLTKKETKECVLYISNHQCTVDWAVADMLAIRQGCLGNLRYVLKHALQYMPLYGYYFYMHGCVYVRRAGQFQKDTTSKQFEYIAQLQQPTWLVIFPEGTRYSPTKRKAIEESRKYAQELGLEPLEYVLMPRSRGFEMALTHLRHRLDAVYDVTIAYSQSVDANEGRVKSAPSMFDFVSSNPGSTVHVHLQRIPIDQVPSGSGAIRKWLYDRFKRKDQLLKAYYARRLASKKAKIRIDDDEDVFSDLKIADARLPLKSTLPSVLLISGCGLLPFILTETGRKAYLLVLAFGTLFGVAYLRVSKAA